MPVRVIATMMLLITFFRRLIEVWPAPPMSSTVLALLLIQLGCSPDFDPSSGYSKKVWKVLPLPQGIGDITDVNINNGIPPQSGLITTEDGTINYWKGEDNGENDEEDSEEDSEENT
jgi:hypothetical protein